MIDSLYRKTIELRVKSTILAAVALLLIALPAAKPVLAEGPAQGSEAPPVTLDRNDDEGRLRVLIDGKEALVYLYGKDRDLVHYYPVRSPSGKSMTVQQTEPYPHHRSFWFGDLVQLAGQRKASFYSPLYSGKDRKPPFKDHVRHVEFAPEGTEPAPPVIRPKLVWEMDGDKPVLDEARELRVVALGDGEYFLDVTFTVTASYGDVTFASDWVHYAWPYIRMCTAFSGDQGGTITNSEGGVGQAETNGKEAVWIDYSNTVEGATEGLAIFSHPDNDQPHKWLTREYGCFGPRRIDARSGKPYTLKKGESISRRVGVLVHRGDVKDGRVAERYEAYLKGEL